MDNYLSLFSLEETEIPETQQMKHPYPVKWFQTNRVEQYVISMQIKNLIQRKKNIIVRAEEKSGKRVIAEIISLLIPTATHYFATNLNRKDIDPQFQEQSLYGIKNAKLKNKRDVGDLIKELDTHSSENPDSQIIIHFDECDYGTGTKQSFSGLWKYIISRHPNILAVLYSATPEEAVYTLTTLDSSKEKWIECCFKPALTYKGARWYLDENLIHPAERFVNIDEDGNLMNNFFTQHGVNCILNDLNLKTGKNFGVLRLTGSKNKKPLYHTLKEAWKDKAHPLRKICRDNFNICLYFIDAKNSMNWSSEFTSAEYFNPTRKYLLIINQTCTRSTEVHNVLKEQIGFWHDNRYLKNFKQGGHKTYAKCYNTISQALGRVKGYLTPSTRIIIYGDPDVFRYNCGELQFDQSELARVKISSRLGCIGPRTITRTYYSHKPEKWPSTNAECKRILKQINKLFEKYPDADNIKKKNKFNKLSTRTYLGDEETGFLYDYRRKSYLTKHGKSKRTWEMTDPDARREFDYMLNDTRKCTCGKPVYRHPVLVNDETRYCIRFYAGSNKSEIQGTDTTYLLEPEHLEHPKKIVSTKDMPS